MAKIAILSSTSPLRKTSAKGGVTQQRFNPEACNQLAELFDLVIVGSTAHDAVFDHMAQNLPRTSRIKFRFYARSYFARTIGQEEGDLDGRNAGWGNILAENRISFDPLITKPGSKEQKKFDWRTMQDFVTDRNVVFVSGSEGQLIYTKPTRVRNA